MVTCRTWTHPKFNKRKRSLHKTQYLTLYIASLCGWTEIEKNSLKFAFYRSYICTISSKLIDLTRSNITLIYSNLLLISGTCFIVAICFVFAIKVIIARKTRKRQQKTHFSKTDQTQLVFIVQIS